MNDELLEELAALDGDVLTEVTVEQFERDPDDEEATVWHRLPDDVPAVELRLPGEVVNPPKVCQHRAEDVMVETVVAAVTGDPEGTGDPVRWQIRVKAICQCGISFALDREGTAPRDGSSGTVLAMHPITGD